ncbi:MAG: tRNA (N6-isopentenyl adenosine(37)-C2)-methylthiotransferase MiaB [Actinomycetota bacterium]|nr:tRNA (N6-isopentenyl adenosine(37)-C2)-methylthiotransferase MiaB [Actinomycetota bacterium]
MANDEKRYLIKTYGCQMNEHDSERIAGLLEADGYQPTESADDADVIVLNTCCIRENADNKLYGALGHLKPLKDANPNLQIVVGGCLAQKDRDQIQQRAGHVDVVFGTHNVHRATELMAQARTSGPLTEIWEESVLEEARAFPSALPVRRETDYGAWVTIQIGCDNSCAFCIVPAVRGSEISRLPDDIEAEVRRLAGEGVTEVTLLGQNVNSFGRDLALAARQAGEDVRVRPMFADLLRTVGSIDGIRRVRYTSPHPKDMTTDVFAAMEETAAVVPHLHFPLQSGSDRVLSAMHRGYTAERYLAKLAEARSVITDLAVTTDIIVGFPGETDDDFERTLEVAAAAEFDSAYTFVFSPREGTEAALMVDDFCDPEAVKERYARLRVVIERSARKRHEARVGRVEEVVVEGPSKKDPSVLTGRTRQNKLVHFASEPLRPGTFADVRVTEGHTQYLMGELVQVTSRPTHRTRIPVAAN